MKNTFLALAMAASTTWATHGGEPPAGASQSTAADYNIPVLMEHTGYTPLAERGSVKAYSAQVLTAVMDQAHAHAMEKSAFNPLAYQSIEEAARSADAGLQSLGRLSQELVDQGLVSMRDVENLKIRYLDSRDADTQKLALTSANPERTANLTGPAPKIGGSHFNEDNNTVSLDKKDTAHFLHERISEERVAQFIYLHELGHALQGPEKAFESLQAAAQDLPALQGRLPANPDKDEAVLFEEMRADVFALSAIARIEGKEAAHEMAEVVLATRERDFDKRMDLMSQKPEAHSVYDEHHTGEAVKAFLSRLDAGAYDNLQGEALDKALTQTAAAAYLQEQQNVLETRLNGHTFDGESLQPGLSPETRDAVLDKLAQLPEFREGMDTRNTVGLIVPTEFLGQDSLTGLGEALKLAAQVETPEGTFGVLIVDRHAEALLIQDKEGPQELPLGFNEQERGLERLQAQRAEAAHDREPEAVAEVVPAMGSARANQEVEKERELSHEPAGGGDGGGGGA